MHDQLLRWGTKPCKQMLDFCGCDQEQELHKQRQDTQHNNFQNNDIQHNKKWNETLSISMNVVYADCHK